MNRLIDTVKHQGQRRRLIDLLKEKGIKDENVIEAMYKTPRHWFMDIGLESHAYVNKAIAIDADQTISHPYTVALQSELIAIQKGSKVLEIGTGSGYQTAVLRVLGAEIYTIERQRELYKKTSRLLDSIGCTVKKKIFGDGYIGLKEVAPFDAIIVTAGAPDVPKSLLEQLAIGGRLVIPVGVDSQIMYRFTRTSQKSFDKESFGEFRFVPLLKDRT